MKAGNAPDVTTIEYQMVSGSAGQGNLIDLTEYAGETVRRKFPQPSGNRLDVYGGRPGEAVPPAGRRELSAAGL